MLKFIELKTGHTDNGPAWIGLVKQSKSGKTIYFNGKAFSRGNGISGNHFDVETGDEYWISNIKKNGQDRHWAGSGKIRIEFAAIDEYLKIIEMAELNKSKFEVSHEVLDTDVSKFSEMLNEKFT